MADGHMGKCKTCTKKDVSKRTVPRTCVECNKDFMAVAGEVTRKGGGANTCSRACYYAYQPKMLEKKWDGKRGYYGLHAWVERKLGKPNLCAFCGKTEGTFHWSNISQEYKEDINDWQRLCVPCHRKYDDSGAKAWITRRKNMGVQ